MQEYAACPRQEDDLDLESRDVNSPYPDTEHTHHETTEGYENISIRSSLELNHPDRSPSATPPPASMKQSRASSQLKTTEASGSGAPRSTFRAALVASVGVCYTQYLWATLRDRVLKIGLVEDLFQIQTNAFHLMSPNLYIRTPLLAAVAVFCWIVPLATIYPPSALSVELRSLWIPTEFNVSTFHVQNYQGTETEQKPIAGQLCLGNTNQTILPSYQGCSSTVSLISGTDDTKYVTRSCLMSGDLASVSPPIEGNVSYSLELWGTDLDCKSTNHTEDISVPSSRFRDGGNTWLIPDLDIGNSVRVGEDSQGAEYKPVIIRREILNDPKVQYYPCLTSTDLASVIDDHGTRINVPNIGIRVLTPIRETTCRPTFVKYALTFLYTGGKQHVSHEIIDRDYYPRYTPSPKFFNGSFEQWTQFSDALTVFGDFARNLNKSFATSARVEFESPTIGLVETATPYITANGTTTMTCVLHSARFSVSIYAFDIGPEIWPMSVFERRPVRPTIYPGGSNFDFDKARDLLFNSTISMLALNRRFEVVNGTAERLFNVYRFQNKLAFYLPYGLSLGLGLPIIALGLAAFYIRNQGVSAISGGFLQILMTTRGHGMLDYTILKGSGTLGGHENVTQELKDLDVSFGELINDNAGRKDGPCSVCNHSHVNEERPESLAPVTQGDCNPLEYSDAVMASGVHLSEKAEIAPIRAGFGTPQEGAAHGERYTKVASATATADMFDRIIIIDVLNFMAARCATSTRTVVREQQEVLCELERWLLTGASSTSHQIVPAKAIMNSKRHCESEDHAADPPESSGPPVKRSKVTPSTPLKSNQGKGKARDKTSDSEYTPSDQAETPTPSVASDSEDTPPNQPETPTPSAANQQPPTPAILRNGDKIWRILDKDSHTPLQVGVRAPQRLVLRFQNRRTNLTRTYRYRTNPDDIARIDWNDAYQIRLIMRWRNTIFYRLKYPLKRIHSRWSEEEVAFLTLVHEKFVMAVQNDRTVAVPDKHEVFRLFEGYFGATREKEVLFSRLRRRDGRRLSFLREQLEQGGDLESEEDLEQEGDFESEGGEEVRVRVGREEVQAYMESKYVSLVFDEGEYRAFLANRQASGETSGQQVEERESAQVEDDEGTPDGDSQGPETNSSDSEAETSDILGGPVAAAYDPVAARAAWLSVIMD
ncbi:hypothetical protein OPT61_g81 [Boeremia exigua]|uniref:Uncharacterized protein n=1 Tax=Boeremia exigua TaxID=749465 RepID=A0ACC2IVF1_9PLEO|nr:hypothetical protein OPT61_g81 [Boeremia exigua]